MSSQRLAVHVETAGECIPLAVGLQDTSLPASPAIYMTTTLTAEHVTCCMAMCVVHAAIAYSSLCLAGTTQRSSEGAYEMYYHIDYQIRPQLMSQQNVLW